jgi:hypothetical protein
MVRGLLLDDSDVRALDVKPNYVSEKGSLSLSALSNVPTYLMVYYP